MYFFLFNVHQVSKFVSFSSGIVVIFFYILKKFSFSAYSFHKDLCFVSWYFYIHLHLCLIIKKQTTHVFFGTVLCLNFLVNVECIVPSSIKDKKKYIHCLTSIEIQTIVRKENLCHIKGRGAETWLFTNKVLISIRFHYDTDKIRKGNFSSRERRD